MLVSPACTTYSLPIRTIEYFFIGKSPKLPRPHGRRRHSGDVPVGKITDARVVYRLLTGSQSEDYLRHSSRMRFNYSWPTCSDAFSLRKPDSIPGSSPRACFARKRYEKSKSQGHTHMAACEAQPLVKPLRIDAGVMRQ